MQQQDPSGLATPDNAPGPRSWMGFRTQLGTDAWIALALTFFGWFGLDTLRVEWGPWSQGIHFYDMADVIALPARLFNGLEANRGIRTVVFMLLCTTALLAPWALSLRRNRFAWLGWFAPLALVVCVALLLKARTSGDLLQEGGLVDTLGNDVRHLANHLFRSASAGVARKVKVSAGGYLALASSAYLAWCGIQHARNARALAREIV
jgi:hypothetical protein